MEQSAANQVSPTTSSQLQTQANVPTAGSSKIHQPVIKHRPTVNTTKGVDARGRGQFFLRGDSLTESNKFHNTSGMMGSNSQQQPDPSHTDSAQERIKIGQELNNNRPKESKGHRSTEKRQLNNQSLGVTSISVGPGHGMPLQTSHIKRLNHPKGGNFVSSPIAAGVGGRDAPSDFLAGYRVTSLGGTQDARDARKGSSNMAALFSHTGKLPRGAKRGKPGEGLQQSSMQATDKLLDLSEDPLGAHSGQFPMPFTANN